METESIWKIILQSTGMAGVGAFLLWSLYNKWLNQTIFSKLTKKQTFHLMFTFLLFTFLISGMLIFAHLKETKESDQANSNSIHSGDGSTNIISEDDSNATIY